MRIRHITGSLSLATGLGLLAWTGVPQAASGLTITSVTGTVAHGSTITLNGSGFGTKATVAPVKYDDFEGGSSGSRVANGWESDGYYTQPVYSTSKLRPNSSRSVMCAWTAPRRSGDDGVNFGVGISSTWPRNSGNISAVYIDAWYYLEANSPYMRNHKLWRLHTGNVDQPNLYANVYGDEDLHRIGQDGLANGAMGYTGWSMDGGTGYGATYLVGHWNHIQAWITESSPGVQNGQLWVAINNHVGVNNVIKTRDADTHWNQLFLGNYMSDDVPAGSGGGKISSNIYTHWDNVYIDTYRQHVEIGNNSVYANCTQREIQVPTAWSNTSVSVTVNRGGFSSLSGLYAFIVDDAGNVSPGFPLSSAGGPTGPVAPIGVHIVTG